MEANENPCPSPYPTPSSSSSSLLKDISNFKTPKRPSNAPKFTSPCPQFFTASKQTPQSSCSSSVRRCLNRPSLSARPKQKTATARRLKAFELEQSQSSRKAEIKKEKSLQSLAKSLTTWLNFLFQNPRSCGCQLTGIVDQDVSLSVKLGKRDVGQMSATVGVEAAWRSPKRQRDLRWEEGGDRVELKGEEGLLSSKSFGLLRNSLKDVCSFDDLIQRMRVYLSLATCKEIFDVMTQVVKNIDEGRLKMKSNCPMATDVGMKERAIKILMSYNPVWLRVGLHIIFGGDSLLPNGNANSDHDIAFLKMVIEKQFFSHAELAREYAYNKKVEGLYRPGYYEKLGSVMLKRFLLLVLLLDRAKSHGTLSLKYGIDGVDGGCPLLFSAQSSIKSSRQMVNDFLSSDNMLGEGNLLAHLVIIGYKLSYQQSPLVEYDFKVVDLFEDLQDGVRLCRAIQLLQNDSSILMKIVVPSDTRKKNLVNCGVALQYLKKTGLTLCDEDGVMITEDDIVNGDKELTVSLLWNMFVHFQLPLLINKTVLADEIFKIEGSNMDSSNSLHLSSLELLLKWIQVVCEKYDLKLDSFSSLVDGKAIWCLLDYYFRKELWCSHKDPHESSSESIMSVTEYTDAVHNFILSQKLTTLLGNFPEVLQISDILEHSGAINEKSVLVLLVFLASQLTAKKTLDRLNFHKLLCSSCQSPEKRQSKSEAGALSFKALLDLEEIQAHSSEDASGRFQAIKAWWQDMAARNNRFVTVPANSTLQQSSSSRSSIEISRENAAINIQSHLRKLIARRKFLKMMDAVHLLQIVIRAWLIAKQKSGVHKFNLAFLHESTYGSCASLLVPSNERRKHSGGERYAKCIVERHMFLKIKSSAICIQKAARIWIKRRLRDKKTTDLVNAAIVVQKYWRSCTARSHYKAIQMSSISLQHIAATKIQSHLKAWLLRRKFLKHKQSITKIQSNFRRLRCWRSYQKLKISTRSAITIQSHVRGWIARKVARQYRRQISSTIYIQKAARIWIKRRLQDKRTTDLVNATIVVQKYWRSCTARSQYKAIRMSSISLQHIAATRIQSHLKAWLLRRKYLKHKHSITKIQSNFRRLRCWRSYQTLKINTRAAIKIQSHVRGWIARKVARKYRRQIGLLQACFRCWHTRKNFLLLKEAATKIQCAVRNINCRKALVANTKAAIEIQRISRGHIARKRLLGASHLSVVRHCNFETLATSVESTELKIKLSSVLKLQSWWRRVLLHKQRTKSAIVIQSYIRAWIAQRMAANKRRCAVIIQSYWKGYIARKESKGQLFDLRLRVQKSAKNVDDSRRIINRLKMALAELLSMKSVSGILHTCATLEMTTKHSQKCCEELVAAGAIPILLKLIQSVSRSIPDQAVLKHALSTIRNLTRYQHLTEVLINSRGSIGTIFLEFLRNKEEGYFIASEILKKISLSEKGVESMRKVSGLTKRLHNIVEELTRKAAFEKRNNSVAGAREKAETRLREAAELLKLVTANHSNSSKAVARVNR